MKRPISLFLISITLLANAAYGATQGNVWSAITGPLLPLRYADLIPVLQKTDSKSAHAAYASAALYLRLFPSIDDSSMENSPPKTNITRLNPSNHGYSSIFRPRVNLSPSYVQEFAYIDTYSNIRKYDNTFVFPSIRMELALPRFGVGFGGGYQNSQFGFGPVAFRF